MLFWNNAASSLFGWTAGETVGHPLPIVPDQEKGAFREQLERCLDGENNGPLAGSRLCKDGTLIRASLSTSPLRDESGEIVGAVGVLGNPATQNRVEQELNRTASLSGAVFESLADAVFVVDPALRVIMSTNPAIEKVFGYAPDEVVNRSTEVLHKDRRSFEEFGESSEKNLERDGIYHCTRQMRRKNGDLFWADITVTELDPALGRGEGVVSVVRDVSEGKRAEEAVEKLAYFDPLTGLPNRRLLNDRLSQYLAQADRHGSKVGVFYFDLDQFKKINDSLGHEAGDKMLMAVAGRLRECVRKTDTISRLGGDEFVAVLADVPGENQVDTVARQILETMATPYSIDRREIFSSCSIGITIYPNDADDAATLLRNADLAMYAAKQAGRNTFKFFSEDLNQKAQKRLDTEHRLRRAIGREEFVLHYQPQVDLHSGQVTGMEALVRWVSPDDGKTIFPADFIPIAEETGLIIDMGQWVLQEACRHNKGWLDAGYPPMTVSVNLSAPQFLQPDLADIVEAVLNETGLPARCLKLEISETILMEYGRKTAETMDRLNRLGVAFAIDDFGKGYSSLSYLKTFPIDILKVDQTFVRNISADPGAAAIVDAIISLGTSLRLDLVAEGVETKEQLDYLVQRDCWKMQGYYFSRPLPNDKIEAFLQSFSRSDLCPFLLE